MTSSYAWWERHGPRLPSHGIKAHTRRGAFGRTWWASRWIAALERLVNPGRLARGRTYARTGQVVSMDVDRDGVKAVVQGSRPKPYKVSIHFRRLTDAEWDRVIDAMAGEALYAARLLSGEMPEHIEEVFSSVGAGARLRHRVIESGSPKCSSSPSSSTVSGGWADSPSPSASSSAYSPICWYTRSMAVVNAA